MRFLVSSALVLVLIAILGGSFTLYVHQTPDAEPSTSLEESCQIRTAPLVLCNPRRNVLQEIPSERLNAAWQKLLPHSPTRWVTFLHEIRLWGTTKNFPQPSWSGERMLSLLLDNNEAQRYFGRPMIIPTRHGLQFWEAEPTLRQGERHFGQTLSVLARLEIESTRRIRIGDRDYTIADAVRHQMMNVTPEEEEVEWITIGLAHYLPPLRQWKNKFGQVVSFDSLCERLCNRPPGQGPCFGCHNFYALAILICADDQTNVLSESIRRRALLKLASSIKDLEQTQLANGSWAPGGAQPVATNASKVKVPDLVMTGHSLEWLMLVSDDIPCRATILIKGAEFLVSRIIDETPLNIADSASAYTHAGIALRLCYPDAWGRMKTIWKDSDPNH
jgi:hypothetical protein